MTMTEHDQPRESFAKRWSRRKGGLDDANEQTPDSIGETLVDEDGAQILTPEAAQAQTVAREGQRIKQLAELNALTDEDMPDVESLSEDSDFSSFMSENVSEALRKVALRKLFHGESYNIRDGLDEYDGDYTSFEKLDPTTITCDMKHMIEVEEEKKKALAALEDDALLTAEEEGDQDGTGEPLEDQGEEGEEVSLEEVVDEAVDEASPAVEMLDNDPSRATSEGFTENSMTDQSEKNIGEFETNKKLNRQEKPA